MNSVTYFNVAGITPAAPFVLLHQTFVPLLTYVISESPRMGLTELLLLSHLMH